MGHFLLRLSSKFTYFQKIVLATCLLLSSLAISLYFNWKIISGKIEDVQQQQQGTQNAVLVKKLLENISRHAVMLVSMQLDQNSYQNDIIQMQAQISADFRKLGLGTFKNRVPYSGFTSSPVSEDLGSKWNLFLENIEDARSAHSMVRFHAIADRLILRLLYIGTRSGIFRSEKIPYFLSELAFVELPRGVSLIAQIVLLSTDKKQENAAIAALIAQLQEHTHNLENLLEIAHLSESDTLTKSLEEYRKNIFELIAKVESLNSQKTFIERSAIIDLGVKALREGTFVWNSTLESMDVTLNETLNFLKTQKKWVVLGSLILASLGFLVILSGILQAYKPFQEMIKAIQTFKSGDLTVRIPLTYQDEIGGFGILLNQIADRFEETYRQLEKTGISLSICSGSISDASKQLESTAIEQETASKQIAVNAKEISATAKEFSNTLNNMSTIGQEASALANSGMTGLSKMESTMQQMIEASSSIATKLGVLNDKAQSVTNIITTISKVAQQTNLLSLNAAIEAEKAGEHGRSFAVISREIRRLAEQTAYATIDMEKMINEMVSAVSASVLGVDKFMEEINQGVTYIRNVGEQLTQIIDQVQRQMTSFEDVNVGMLNQSQGAAHITEAISQWSESAQQATSSIRKFHQTVEQLSQTSRQLHDVVQYIKHH